MGTEGKGERPCAEAGEMLSVKALAARAEDLSVGPSTHARR